MRVEAIMAERTTLHLEKDPNVNDLVVTVGEEALRLFDLLLNSTEFDKSNNARRSVQFCLAYYLAKIQRVTRAALTLILTGQGSEAMGLIREQHDFVLALNYYQKHQREALLFVLSQALLKRNFARDVMLFKDSAANDPKRVAQLADLEKTADTLYLEFPDLRRPKGKSGKSKSPVMIDWAEASSYDMLVDLMDGWMRERHKDTGQIVDEADFVERHEKAVKSVFFLRSTFISQSKHGTAFDAGGTLGVDDAGNIEIPGHQTDDPNHLAYHFIQNALPVLVTYRKEIAPESHPDEFDALGSSYVALRDALGIVDEPVNL
jgi:hypothetical protein